MDLVPFWLPSTRSKNFDFAKKYNLEIKTVVKPYDKKENFEVKDEAYPGPGTIINSDFLNGLAPDNSVIKLLIF